MSLRLLYGALPRSRSPSVRCLSSRVASSRTSPRPRFTFNSRLSRIGIVSGVAVLATPFLLLPLHADAESSDEKTQSSSSKRPPTSISSYVRSYVVYSIVSFPGLVDWSPKILSICMSVPVLRQITEAFVRVTFFNQFVGGDTAHETLPLLETLRAENKGCLFAYSVEVDEEEATGKEKAADKEPVYKQIVQEMIRSIEVAADFEDNHRGAQEGSKGRRTWVAVKLTALLPNARSLINLSKHIVQTRPQVSSAIPFPGCPHALDLDVLQSTRPPFVGSPLTEQDIVDLKDLYDDLVRVCKVAQQRGVRIIIDAEHSWYTPATDAFTLALTRQFNKLPEQSSQPSLNKLNVQPLIYGTYQAYLRRTPGYITQSLADAKAGNYSLGIKLVRGAYHPHEMNAHTARLASATPSLSISPEALPPVWPTKPETDACYNSCLKVVLENIAQDVAEAEATTKKRTEVLSAKPSNSVVARARSFSLSSLFGKASSIEKVAETQTKSSPAVTSTPPPTIGALFGSHNWESVKLILNTLVEKELASVEGTNEDGEAIIRINDEVTERVTLGQLYGMSDHLTNYVVDRTRSSSPMVLKYVPYGALVEVMPYLGRRAIENKSVLGNGTAAEERRIALAEIKKRLF